MQPSPNAFFRFAAEHVDLLLDLFHSPEGLTEGELHQLVRRHRNTEPTPEHVTDRLLALGFIEPAPDASARFELTRPVETLLRHLLREQRLSSVAVVQSYINDLQLLSNELDQAVQSRSRGLATHILDEIAAQIDRIRHDSRANRDSITSEVMRLRANAEGRTPRERYEIVNRLWEHYLKPLSDFLNVDRAMEQCLDRLGRLFVHGRTLFQSDGHLHQEFGRAQARLLRLRRETAKDLDECVREVAPLYTSLRRDTRIVQGASEALRIARTEGIAALHLANHFSLSTFRREGLLGSGALEAYLFQVSRYEPPQPTSIPEGIAATRSMVIDDATLHAAASDEPTPDDLIAWLIRRFPDASPAEILRAYGVFLRGLFGRVEMVGEHEEAYPIGEVTLHAVPTRVAAG